MNLAFSKIKKYFFVLFSYFLEILIKVLNKINIMILNINYTGYNEIEIGYHYKNHLAKQISIYNSFVVCFKNIKNLQKIFLKYG